MEIDPFFAQAAVGSLISQVASPQGAQRQEWVLAQASATCAVQLRFLNTKSEMKMSAAVPGHPPPLTQPSTAAILLRIGSIAEQTRSMDDTALKASLSLPSEARTASTVKAKRPGWNCFDNSSNSHGVSP